MSKEEIVEKIKELVKAKDARKLAILTRAAWLDRILTLDEIEKLVKEAKNVPHT